MPLNSLVYSILESIKGHSSNYAYPLTNEMHVMALELSQKLTSGSLDRSIMKIFHKFIYSLLSYSSSIDENNKWSMVAECWLAISSIREAGNFIAPKDLSGVLAKMEYHCRAVTLYESHLQVDKFDNSLIK